MTEDKAKFFPRTQWAHPKSTICLRNVSKKNLDKLKVWVDKHDRIEVLPGSKEVYLLNQSTWPQEKGAPWTDQQYDKFVKGSCKEERRKEGEGPQPAIDGVLTKIEALLDGSDLNGEEIETVLDCLKVKYKSGP